MQHGKIKLALATAGALAASLSFVAQPAFGDYAPVSKDVVGVGSDTVQYASDFIADGDFLGDGGFNSLSPKYRIINFDATPDANARLAYGPDGVGNGSATACAPGTGATAGTNNQNTKHADTPCTLNPTIVLRAGQRPIQRPNGSGDGAKALLADTSHFISYSRASSAQAGTSGTLAGGAYDSITVGTDKLAMLAATSTNAVPLSTGELKNIYNCASGFTKWNQLPGNSGGSSDTIVPIIPQVGSGTRSTFLADIGLSAPNTACVVTAEENDPTAIAAQGANAADAIEPMSGGRLNLFQGKMGDGSSNGVGGYFRDASCKLPAVNSSTPAACGNANNTLTPDVAFLTGTPGDNTTGLYTDTRNLYIYFRDADVNSSTTFEPGSTLNFVRTLFYNPCSGTGHTTGCTTVGSQTYGPGGAPYYASDTGQALISAAGINPTYAFTPGGA